MIKRLILFCFVFGSIALSQQWELLNTIPNSANVSSIAVVNQNVIWIACNASQIFLSEDGGQTWVLRNTGLPSTDLYGISAIDNMNCWVGTLTGSIYRTSDGGNSWSLQVAVSGSFINGIHMFDLNNGVYTGDPTGNGVPYQNRYTTDGGTTWTLAPNSPIGTNEFGVINAWDWTDQNTFWIGSANTTANATTAKIFYTTTGFAGTWNFTTVPGTGGSAGLYYQAIAFTDATHGMAGSNGSDIVKTTDGGVTWQPTSIPPNVTTFAAINSVGLKNGSNTYRFVLNEGVSYRMFKTTDQGTTWEEETLPAPAVTNGVQHMVFLNSNLGFAGGGSGVFLKYTGAVPVELTSFVADANYGQVKLNWTTATETNNQMFEIQRKSENTEFNTIGYVDGAGTTTEEQQYTYTDRSVPTGNYSYRLKQIDFDGTYEYSDIVEVDVKGPLSFDLKQNYPNPFNPSTKINFSIPKAGDVKLAVYNTVGEEVAVLVDGFMQEGFNQIIFDASSLPSGMYIYKIQSDQSILTKKMMLLK